MKPIFKYSGGKGRELKRIKTFIYKIWREDKLEVQCFKIRSSNVKIRKNPCAVWR